MNNSSIELFSATNNEVNINMALAAGLSIGCISFCTIIGNIFVINAIRTDHQLRQRYANRLVSSLAVTDLLVGLTVIPMAAVYQIYGYWIAGEAMCMVYLMADLTLCTTSILHLVAIALDTFFFSSSLTYSRDKKKQRRFVKIAVGICWSIPPAVVCLPNLVMLLLEPDRNGKECIISQQLAIAVYSTLTAFYIPTGVLIYVYVRLFLHVRKRSKKLLKRSGEYSRNVTEVAIKDQQGKTVVKNFNGTKLESTLTKANNTDPSTKQLLNKKSAECLKLVKRRERKALCILLIITGVFCICWLPFFVNAVITPFNKNLIPSNAKDIFTWLGYSNSMLNPVIYTVFIPEFRKSFKKSLPCCN
ncbi:hypothetical protein EB796_003387 [Bugula neritina]|uniref:G-protein coupled receptors family 1 profile domain-containing protein n=1 Tax=Bugula neritina TaxID=10212 RepID=A0A7J7KLD0_BUGNE|nr:hypothetical protein EB796_003387 [Bugula neritina]